jgi:hypothetical protein
MTDVDAYIVGYAELAKEWGRRGIPVTPLTLKRKCARGDFPKAVPLTGDLNSKGGRRGWRQSVIDAWFLKREEEAAARAA